LQVDLIRNYEGTPRFEYSRFMDMQCAVQGTVEDIFKSGGPQPVMITKKSMASWVPM